MYVNRVLLFSQSNINGNKAELYGEGYNIYEENLALRRISRILTFIEHPLYT